MFWQSFLIGILVSSTIILGAKYPNCGKTPIPPDTLSAEFIVGGKVAKPYSWPWQVELCKVSDAQPDVGCSFKCGGSIIDKQWILSASHCELEEYEPGQWYAKAGTFKYNDDDEPGEIIIKISQVVTHPSYNIPMNASNDIALFKADQQIQFTDHIQPVCVAKNVSDIVHAGKSAFVTGWGLTYPMGDASIELKQVEVPFLEMSECIKEYQGEIDSTMECAGKEGADSCNGDSGGPLVTQHKDGRWFQAGIVSFGPALCGRKGEAGVYSRPSANCDFLKSVMEYDICQ